MIPVSWRIIAGLTLALAISFGLNTCTANDRNHWRDAAHAQQRAVKAWKGAFGRSEAARKAERRQSVAAVNDADKACDARVDAARSSARTIQTIIERPVRYDANNCPVRELADPRLVRDALQPSGSGAPRR